VRSKLRGIAGKGIIVEGGAGSLIAHSLILVSSAPHTRRASMIFKAAFKNSEKPVCIFCSPSPYTVFNAEKWWKRKDDIETVLLEYLKLMNFVLFDRHKLKQEIADYHQCR